MLHRSTAFILVCQALALALALACGGGGGGGSQVSPPVPLITSFKSSAPVVAMGAPATLTWELDASVTGLTLDGAPVTATSGQVQVTPSHRQTYTLVAKNAKGSQETATVAVAARGLDLLAGSIGGQGMLDGQGSHARLTFAGPVAADAQGNLIFADYFYNVVRKVGLDGTVTTLAGVPGNPGYLDGPAATAQFSTITGLAVAQDGTIIVVDHDNAVLRKILDGQVSTFVSLGGGGSGYILENPAFDAAGNLYVPLNMMGKVSMVTPAGAVSDAVTGLTYPSWASVSPAGDLWVIDEMGGLVYQIGPGGTRTLVSFTYAAGDPGGTGAVAGMKSLAFDGAGHMYLCGYTQILQVDATNQVTTLAQVDGNGNGSGYFETVAWSPAGFLWAPETSNGGVIGKVAPGLTYTPVAGAAAQVGDLDGPGAQALFNGPGGIAFDLSGNVLVADGGNGRLRSVAPDGTVATLPLAGGAAPGSCLWMDPKGDLYFTAWSSQAVLRLSQGQVSVVASQTPLDAVQGITGDGAGNLFVTDDPWESGYARVQEVTTSGAVTFIAGNYPGQVDGQGASARFSTPHGITWSQGLLFVADAGSGTIRTVSADGTVTTLAGSLDEAPGFADGEGSTARFSDPEAVAMAPDGHLFVADAGNHCIRMITPQGDTTTVVGNPASIGLSLGPTGTLANPIGILATPKGDLVILDGGAILLYTAPEGQ